MAGPVVSRAQTPLATASAPKITPKSSTPRPLPARRENAWCETGSAGQPYLSWKALPFASLRRRRRFGCDTVRVSILAVTSIPIGGRRHRYQYISCLIRPARGMRLAGRI